MSLPTYEKLEKQVFQPVSGKSTVISKGIFKLNFGNRKIAEAYHTPCFQTNISSVGVLLRHFNISFTSNSPAMEGASICSITRRCKATSTCTTEIQKDLLSVNHEDSNHGRASSKIEQCME